jgi:hypothetical protein
MGGTSTDKLSDTLSLCGSTASVEPSDTLSFGECTSTVEYPILFVFEKVLLQLYQSDTLSLF